MSDALITLLSWKTVKRILRQNKKTEKHPKIGLYSSDCRTGRWREKENRRNTIQWHFNLNKNVSLFSSSVWQLKVDAAVFFVGGPKRRCVMAIPVRQPAWRPWWGANPATRRSPRAHSEPGSRGSVHSACPESANATSPSGPLSWGPPPPLALEEPREL